MFYKITAQINSLLKFVFINTLLHLPEDDDDDEDNER